MIPSYVTQLKHYDKRRSKSVLFFTGSTPRDVGHLVNFGIREILISYYYIRLSPPFYSGVLDTLSKENGLFMTDSGAFSFKGTYYDPKMKKPEYWIPYIEEYVQWLTDNKGKIFCAANLDLDSIVGRDKVDKWNAKYFEPLEKYMNIVYVAHNNDTDDKNGVRRFKEYCKKYSYVGINQSQKESANKFYEIAQITGTKVHGFAWTEAKLLKNTPFFSVDSSTWLGGLRYGTTYDYDGKNFRTIAYYNKYRRKGNKNLYADFGVDIKDVTGKVEKKEAINNMNIIGWLGLRKEYVKSANVKLRTKEVSRYEKLGGKS